MTRDNGGPAFPVTEEQGPSEYGSGPGMTQLDYFAAKALVGILAGIRAGEPDLYYMNQRPTPQQAFIPFSHAELYAKAAYQLGRAMIAERDKGQDA